MNREQFFDKLATFDEERLKKALWNVYWRGSAVIRERIEFEVDGDHAIAASASRRSRLIRTGCWVRSVSLLRWPARGRTSVGTVGSHRKSGHVGGSRSGVW